jgi:hypothetical protein
MREAYACGDDIDLHASAGVGVSVGIIEREVALVYAIKAPGRIRLNRLCGEGRRAGLKLISGRIIRDYSIFLNVGNKRVLAQCQGAGRCQLYREPFDGILIDVIDSASMRPGQLKSEGGNLLRAYVIV